MDRGGIFLDAFAAPGSAFPSTAVDAALERPLPTASVEALAQAALAGVTLDLGAEFAFLARSLNDLGTLPGEIDAASGASVREAAPDEAARSAAWLALALMEGYRRFPGVPIRTAALARAQAVLAALTAGDGLIRVQGTDLLRESALAGLVALNAARTLELPGAYALGLKALLRIVGRFRTPEAPWRFAAAVGAGGASFAADSEGFALTGLLALAYDVPDVPEQAAAWACAQPARALAPVAWREDAQPLQNAPAGAAYYGGGGVLEGSTTLDVRGLAGGVAGTVSAQATLLTALLLVRLGRFARAAELVYGLDGARHGQGLYSHALREQPTAATLSLAPSVLAEALYEADWLLPS